MTRIIVLRGLPASGKSTWAKSWVMADPSTRMRVNRDDIRHQLYGTYWGDGVDENTVTKVEEVMVRAGLDAGKDVVIDATHLAARYLRRWYNFGVEVEVKDFEVPLEELVERDFERRLMGERGVTSTVIKSLAQRYQIKADGKLPPAPEVEVSSEWTPAPRWRMGLPYVYIVDIDGTVADHRGIRDPYDTSRYQLDKPHHRVIDTVWNLSIAGFPIIFVSGRDEAFRKVTEQWLEDNVGITVEYLFMRPEGDTRNDAVVKHELFHKHIAGVYNVIGVFDDRGRVLRMWRAIGLTTFAVGDTDNYNF